MTVDIEQFFGMKHNSEQLFATDSSRTVMVESG
jgi:hypothetical protein